MTWARLRTVLVAWALVATALMANVAGAQARWGPKENCSAYVTETVNHHCYAIEELVMAGYPTEYVSGSAAFIDTTYMDVPGWASGDFVSNEEWVDFNPGGWIESGQIGGAGYDCCSVHAFFAATTKGIEHGFYFFETPGTVPLNSYNEYAIYDPPPRTTWHVYWGGCCEAAGFGVHEFPSWSNELQAGFEGGAGEQPYNWGRDEVASFVPPTDAWAPYETAYRHSVPFRSPGMCMERNYELPAWGNILWGTCKAPY
ncbi:MAG TPA: hypothetical protein VKG62_09195 [Solirubrobacteraceae bacterium]|nr:hypothetical protein [Solirubrobacteraceae bacterium]